MTDYAVPPRELMEQWVSEKCYDERDWLYEFHIATRAAQWGADQELVACGNYLKQCAQWEEEDLTEFYNYRRPKPPSLKEQALEELNLTEDSNGAELSRTQVDLIRRALEALDD
jgi:hypothetical protein